MKDETPQVHGPVTVPRIDTSIAHAARAWNYLLGGKDNFEADREAAEQMVAVAPSMAVVPSSVRALLGRMVRYLAGECGIRQFLDIGTGIPTMSNVHEIAQAVAPDARIVYVDNDPIVLVHARALLTSTPEGVTAYIDGDVHDPAAIVAEASRTLDFSKPVAYILFGVLQFVVDYQQSLSIVTQLLDAGPPGSYLSIDIPASDIGSEGEDAVRVWNRAGSARIAARTRAEVAGYFSGLELVEPGIVMINDWRPGPDSPRMEIPGWAAIGRKPG